MVCFLTAYSSDRPLVRKFIQGTAGARLASLLFAALTMLVITIRLRLLKGI